MQHYGWIIYQGPQGSHPVFSYIFTPVILRVDLEPEYSPRVQGHITTHRVTSMEALVRTHYGRNCYDTKNHVGRTKHPRPAA